MKVRIYLLMLIVLFSVSCTLNQNTTNQMNYSSLVDTRIGTVGRLGIDGLASGFTYLGATYPFGMMQLTPTHFAPQDGIVVNQISGGGCPEMGNFPLIAFNGPLKVSPNDMKGFPFYKEILSSEAGYLSLEYPDNVVCEITVSKRSGVYRVTFLESAKEGTVIIGSGISSTSLTNALVKITSSTTCEGYAEGGEFCGYPTDYRIFFAAEFNVPAKEMGTWKQNDVKQDRLCIGGVNTGAFFTFDTSENHSVEYKVAISYVSIENARENLRQDNNGRSFDQVLSDTRLEWNKRLGRIEVSGDADRMKQFYTHFYHAMIHPSVFSDVNGEYMGADWNVHKVSEGHDYYSIFSAWDTYRTQCQLLAMLYPDESSDMMQSLVEFAEQSGGYGRWILANIETGVMHGDPTSIIISNSYAFGARNFDVAKAYQYMRKGALIPGTYSQNVEVRPGLKTYIEKGIEDASLCLEYTSADYAIGQFALQAMKNEEDATFFMARAKNWKNLYDPSTRWLRSRDSHDLSWKHPDADWREATKENYFWMVPFDLQTLIDTIGGKQKAEKRLDSLFVRIDASYDDHFFAAGNEPDFQVPWIYNWVKPDKTSAIVSRILKEAYNSTASGLPGNDDCGAMGAWYVFASIGMYPMIPGVGGFSLNMPQFSDIRVTLPEGVLQIKGGVDGECIGSIILNGVEHTSVWLDWEQLRKGGDIVYTPKKLYTDN
ncbi:GH92 family glycosyl hydrolase [Phocaeicola sp. KGMB11183]|uniref:GH92 family glycosyl hydrolase n=1 Tax=Phocaeicola acetigenes TaxID=3016083 RepID=A0ABT4PF47_9BACT|nr:GH92 family glycosyl hydrolase [Phocaeicola sp. KGMB11183]MCZ8371674.1 GH92 family glycosyl hydrolase [Phocaeicola sp. KGMB11183]